MTPMCPSCGTALRWIPAANGWGCDRCRQMVAIPGAGAQGRPARIPANDETRPRSRTWLFALIGLLLAGIAVFAIAATRA